MKGDITKECVECHQPFVLRKMDVDFITSQINDQGYPYQLPKRCKKCRIAKKARYTEWEKHKKQGDTDKIVREIQSGEKITLDLNKL